MVITPVFQTGYDSSILLSCSNLSFYLSYGYKSYNLAEADLRDLSRLIFSSQKYLILFGSG